MLAEDSPVRNNLAFLGFLVLRVLFTIFISFHLISFHLLAGPSIDVIHWHSVFNFVCAESSGKLPVYRFGLRGMRKMEIIRSAIHGSAGATAFPNAVVSGIRKPGLSQSPSSVPQFFTFLASWREELLLRQMACLPRKRERHYVGGLLLCTPMQDDATKNSMTSI